MWTVFLILFFSHSLSFPHTSYPLPLLRSPLFRWLKFGGCNRILSGEIITKCLQTLCAVNLQQSGCCFIHGIRRMLFERSHECKREKCIQ